MRKKEYHLTCIICGKEFISSHANRSYCSDECRLKRKKRQNPNKDLIEMANEAHRLGLSYGKYMQQQYREKNNNYI